MVLGRKFACRMGEKHILYDFTGSDPSLRSKPHRFKCFKGEEVIEDGHTEPMQPQDPLKNNGEELVEINLAHVRKEA